jgi:pyruvate/2-oxoglutarate dehydrogenase complex dihydrolipoamide dehydrogenase (E3) component
MSELRVDVLVIGWGKGGKTLAATLARQGRSVAVVERSREMYGGGCINIACVPTKHLIHSAEQRRPDDDAQEWFAQSVAGRDALTAQLRARNHAMLAELDAVTLIDGEARFVGPHEVEVAGGSDRLRVHAETIVVNTGTRPAWPSYAAVGGPMIFDSETIQHVDPLPNRLVVVGAGYVGVEFAGMFARFGSQVTLVDRNAEWMRSEDRDVAQAVAEVLDDAGVELMLGTTVEQIENVGEGVRVRLGGRGEPRELTADAVLIAVGRVPVTDDLDLAAAAVEVDERGFIVVDDRLRTSASGIFAVGDVNGGPQFTYISLDDFRVVLSQLAGDGARTTADRVAVPNTVFLTPPLARVGMSERDARESGRRVLVAAKNVRDIAAMPRPKIVGDTHGLIKVIVDADTDLVVGATVFSIDAQEVINLLALAMRAGVTASELHDGIWTHPSSTEALNEVLGELRPLA